MPNAANSGRSQPAPTPSVTRPPDSQSDVPAALATTTGSRYGSTSTLVPMPMRSVAAASQPSIASGSG
jgi:hypothetical protein